MTHSFGNNAGEAFAFALKCIYNGSRAKLEKNQGQWTVTTKEVNTKIKPVLEGK